MDKIVLFAFRGEMSCFIHVLVNALDLAEKGRGGLVVVEAEAIRLLPELEKPDSALHQLYARVKAEGLLDAVCRACSTKLGLLAEIEKLGLPLKGEAAGHPGLAGYLERGYLPVTL